jgi:hypothetical protein
VAEGRGLAVARRGGGTLAGGGLAASGLAGGLGLAAAPTFAAMALWTGFSGGASGMLCAAMADVSPVNGMVLMYALMSVFHLAPWLRLIARRRNEGKACAAARPILPRS